MEHVLERIASGELSIADLIGATQESIAALSALGRSAYEAKRFDQAAKIFAGLEALESSFAAHSLRRAECEIRGGHTDEAIASITRYLEHDDLLPEDTVRGLLLRASLVLNRDRDAARADVFTAHVLAESSPAAAAVLKAGGR